MNELNGYKLLASSIDGEIVGKKQKKERKINKKNCLGVAGYRLDFSFYTGKSLYVNDLIVLSSKRGTLL